jgi:hypothetical protein
MSFRVIPKAALPLMLKAHAGAVGIGACLAAFAHLRRITIADAALGATLFIAVADLFVFGFVAQELLAAGVRRVTVIAMLGVMAAAPGALLYTFPMASPVLLAAAFPIALNFVFVRRSAS